MAVNRPPSGEVDARPPSEATGGLWARTLDALRAVYHFQPFRIMLGFALSPLVVLLVLFASPREHAERYLVAGALAWIALLSLVRLPLDATGHGARFRDWLVRRRFRVACALALLLLLPYLLREPLRDGIGGPATLSLLSALLLYLLAVTAYFNRFLVLTVGAGTLRGLAASLLVTVGWPALVLALAIAEDEPPAAKTVLLWAVAVPTAIAVGLRVLAGVRHWRQPEGVEQGHRRQPRWPTRPVTARLAVIGIAAAVLSSALLLATALRVPLERGASGDSSIARAGNVAFAPPAELQGLSGGALDDALARLYAPVLQLHPEERWIASDACLSLGVDCGRDVDCGDGPAPCRTVTAWDGRIAESALATKLENGPRGRSADPVIVSDGRRGIGIAYPAVRGVGPRRPEVGGVAQPLIDRTERVVQYWLFYPYNDWNARTAVGRVDETHEGDWELVAVGLDGDHAPVFVAYSAHCGGTWRPWSHARVVSGTTRTSVVVTNDPAEASHPLVAVALGSHANYPTPGEREPDWAACGAEAGSGAEGPGARPGLRALSYAANAREGTPATGPLQLLEPLPVAEARRIVSLPWYWGHDVRIRVLGGHLKVEQGEHGPSSPAFHREIYNCPLHTIFGGEIDEEDVHRCPDVRRVSGAWSCDAGCDEDDVAASAAAARIGVGRRP